MAKYIKLDAIKARLEDLVGWCQDLRKPGLEQALAMLNEEPVADVAPVVRCKGCKHSTLPSKLTQRYGVPGTLTCHNRYSPCNRRNVGGDNFCSYGERKDGADAEG